MNITAIGSTDNHCALTFDEIAEKIKKGAAAYEFDQYRHYPALGVNSWINLLLLRVQNAFQSDEWDLFYHEINNSPVIMGCRTSSWDEENFGFKLSSILLFVGPNTLANTREIENLLSFCLAKLRKKRVKFVSARINSRQTPIIHAFENRGFRYYESNIWPVTFCGRMDVTRNAPVRLMRAGDLERVREIAGNFHYQEGHFHKDGRFDRQKINRMYAKWVTTAWHNREPVVVIEDNGLVAGCFTFKMDRELSETLGYPYARMRFLALDPAFRGKGLGRDLFLGTVALAKETGADYIDSGYSINNHLSARLHLGARFYPVYSDATLHCWI